MPFSFDHEDKARFIDEIIDRISDGEPLREICRTEGFPKWRTVYAWKRDDKEFAARFARARDDGFDAIAEDCLAIADDARNDYMEKHDAEGNAVGYELNGEHIQRSKVRIETRLKLLAKWYPSKYGERIEHNVKVSASELLSKARKRVNKSAE